MLDWTRILARNIVYIGGEVIAQWGALNQEHVFRIGTDKTPVSCV